MGATNRTDHYDLSQFKGTDKPSWLLDYNGDMSKIDTALYNAADTAAQAADAINEDITPAVDTLKTDVQTLTTQSGAISERVGTAETNITSLTTRANTADNNIAVLATDKQNKALSAPVLIDGVPYSNVEDALRAIAVHGGGDLNEYQKKNLTTPVVIDGTTYTTVEAAINALNMSGGGGGGTGKVYLPGYEQTTREIVHTFDATGSGGFEYELFTIPKDGYYTVTGSYQASTGGTFNGGIFASLKQSANVGASDLAIYFDEAGNNVNELKANPGFLLYCKENQAIYLQGRYQTQTGTKSQARMQVIYTPGIEVEGAGGGGGDLSAYQTKVLSTPIDVDGVQYTTVESAMAAINALAAAGGGGGTGTTNYNVLLNKPKINGVELTGDKSSADLHIESGASDYVALTNKPQINGVTLTGNKTAEDLGISGSAKYIQDNSPHSVTSNQWDEWLGGSTTAISSVWTTDDDSWCSLHLRLARGSSVTLELKIGSDTRVLNGVRFTYPQANGVSTIDTSDYQDFIIPMGLYKKGQKCGIGIQGSPSASLYKFRLLEIDLK